MDDKNTTMIGSKDPKFSLARSNQQSQIPNSSGFSQSSASWIPPHQNDASSPSYWPDPTNINSRPIKTQNQHFFLNQNASRPNISAQNNHSTISNTQLIGPPPPPPNSQSFGSQLPSFSGPNQSQATGPLPLSSDDDLIPTAIVIKNIPFAIKKEQLLDVMTNLHLPIPYAFNYHFDNGVFRGLAFANFATPDETTAVINNLNGREIGGRKLRVEYKKMLPLMERERIEREKREKRGQLEEQHRGSTSKHLRNHNHHQNHHNNQHHLQHQQPFHPSAQPQRNQQNHIGQQQTSGDNAFGGRQNPINNLIPNHLHSSPSPSSPSANMSSNSPSTQPNRPGNSKIDLNDPDNLDLYSKILLFKDDRTRNQMTFPATTSPQQRRAIMLICQQLGVIYNSQDKNVLVVSRAPLSSLSPTNTGKASNNGYNSQQHSQRQFPSGMFDGRNSLQSHSNLSATNVSTFPAQSSLGLQHPQPQSPGIQPFHLQPQNTSLVFPQASSNGSSGNTPLATGGNSVSNNSNSLRGTKSFADIRAPIGNLPASSPGTPVGSPFFASQTPFSSQNQPNTISSQGENSMSFQQQRSGYGFYNQGSQPYLQPAQSQSQMFNSSQQFQQPRQSQFNGISHSQSQLHQSSGPVNDFQLGQHHTLQTHQQQSNSSFGSSGTPGMGSLTDSFSNMLNLGGHSLSRVSSLSSLNPSMNNSLHGSMGSSLVGSSLTGPSSNSIYGPSSTFGSIVPGSSAGSASPATSINSLVGFNNNDSPTKSFGNGNPNANEEKTTNNDNINMTSFNQKSNNSNESITGKVSMDGAPSIPQATSNSTNDSRFDFSSSLTSEAGIIGSKFVASSSSSSFSPTK